MIHRWLKFIENDQRHFYTALCRIFEFGTLTVLTQKYGKTNTLWFIYRVCASNVRSIVFSKDCTKLECVNGIGLSKSHHTNFESNDFFQTSSFQNLEFRYHTRIPKIKWGNSSACRDLFVLIFVSSFFSVPIFVMYSLFFFSLTSCYRKLVVHMQLVQCI